MYFFEEFGSGLCDLNKLSRQPSLTFRRMLSPAPKSRGINDGFIHQHDRDVVPHRVDAPALGALQAFSGLFELQRLLADWADQDVQQILRNHASIVRRRTGLRMRTARDAVYRSLVRRRKATLT